MMTNGMWIRCSAYRNSWFLAAGDGERGYPVLVSDGKMFFEPRTASEIFGISYEDMKKALEESQASAGDGMYGFAGIVLAAAQFPKVSPCRDMLKWIAQIAEEYAVTGECFDTVRMKRHAFLRPGFYTMQRKNLQSIRDKAGQVSVKSLLAQLFMMASDYEITSKYAVRFYAVLWNADEHSRRLESLRETWDMMIGAGIENGKIPGMRELLDASHGVFGHEPG